MNHQSNDDGAKGTRPLTVARWSSSGWCAWITGTDRHANTHDLVEPMHYFYVRVVKAKNLPSGPVSMSVNPFVEVRLGNHKGTTKHFEKKLTPEWNQDVFIAGTDTSSATLVWAMTELVRNPRLMKKAQDEVRTSVGNKGKVEVGDLQSLQFLKSVVKETLRLRNPVPLLLPRENKIHCKIGGYDILPNTRVYINSWGIGRDPKIWDDPEEFIPERFMDGSIDFRGQNFQFIPFGSGRRICPAMNLGIATVEHALANLLYSFEWELPLGMSRDEIDMNEEPGITIHKKVPLHLVATKYWRN